MKININGKSVEIRESLTVAELIREKDLKPEAIVLEVNLKIIDREVWEETLLNAGDSVELISFVGGG